MPPPPPVVMGRPHTDCHTVRAANRLRATSAREAREATARPLNWFFITPALPPERLGGGSSLGAFELEAALPPAPPLAPQVLPPLSAAHAAACEQ